MNTGASAESASPFLTQILKFYSIFEIAQSNVQAGL
jgi:hypothetical protein